MPLRFQEVKEETGVDCNLVGMIGFRTGVLNGQISDHLAIFLLRPKNEEQQFAPDVNEISEVASKTPFELKEDPNVSAMIREIADEAIESGLYQMNEINPGDWFGYTSYKLLFKK